MRSVLFCNEMLGLGHLRLSLVLAQALVADDDRATALVVTASPAFGGLQPPPRVDVLKLPTAPVGPDSAWSRTALRPTAGLALDGSTVGALRADISLAAVEHVRPDVVVVDYLPLGRAGDLEPALRRVRARGKCTVALGLWDADDAPERLRRQWTPELRRAVAELYDLALVYGPSAPDDVRVERLRASGVPVHNTRRVGAAPAEDGPSDLGHGYLLATTGGGADGFPLLDTLLAAIRTRPLGIPTVLVTGPLMAARDVGRLRETAVGLDVRVHAFRADMDAVLAGARAVVAMAGYCTVAEVLASGKPALLVPRAFPREEQLNRARRLAANGRVSMLTPDEADAASLRRALDGLLAREPVPAEAPLGAQDAAGILAGFAPRPC
jgi:predicted glycosyltransferase